MGYTHYWYRPVDGKGEPKDAYGKFVMDIPKIIDAAGVLVAREYDRPDEPPEITEGNVIFNGVGDDGHETFWWPARPEQVEWRRGEPEVFKFCKTAYKPYDTVVCAVLIRAKAHYGDSIRVSSDGDWEPDWKLGADLCERLFGEAENPLSAEEA